MVRSANGIVKKLSSDPTDEAESRKTDSPVGSALRDAYDETLAEAIPPEMLDLLKKLD